MVGSHQEAFLNYFGCCCVYFEVEWWCEFWLTYRHMSSYIVLYIM